MRTKFSLIVFTFSILLSIPVSNGLGQEKEPLSTVEILTLLPRGIDMDGANDQSNYERLVALGPLTFEILGKELLRVEDWITAGRIIAIFVESKGDKAIAEKYLNQFLEIQRSDSWWVLVKSKATEAIKKFQIERTSNAKEQPMNPLPSVQIPQPEPTAEPVQASPAQPPPSSPVRPWAVGLLFLAVFGGVWWKFLRK